MVYELNTFLLAGVFFAIVHLILMILQLRKQKRLYLQKKEKKSPAILLGFYTFLTLGWFFSFSCALVKINFLLFPFFWEGVLFFLFLVGLCSTYILIVQGKAETFELQHIALPLLDLGFILFFLASPWLILAMLRVLAIIQWSGTVIEVIVFVILMIDVPFILFLKKGLDKVVTRWIENERFRRSNEREGKR